MRILIIFLLTIFLFTACKSKPDIVEEPQAEIEIVEPEFEVVSIYILQADIVVTEFEAVLKITNPNEFALELTEVTYELYGNSAFWASGKGSDLLHVPALSSSETKFIFEMNFINMNRKLLDDVIAMRRVNYRFKGDALVQPVLPMIAPFRMNYDCYGLSEVKPRSE